MNEKKEFDRGMYKGAKVSVKVLDTIIVAGILLLFGIIFLFALKI